MVVILKNRNQDGFTLIELLVVISIVGVLSSVVLAATKDVRVRAKNTKFLEDLRQLKNAMELYRNQFNALPGSSGDDSTSGVGVGSLDYALAPLVTNKFIPKIPHHPDWPKNSLYSGSNSNKVQLRYQPIPSGHYAASCGEFDSLDAVKNSGQKAWFMISSNDSDLDNIKLENKYTYCYINDPSDPYTDYRCNVYDYSIWGDAFGFKTHCISF